MPERTSELTPKPERPTRIIDMRFPLHWLVGALGSTAVLLIGTWFSVNELVRDVADLQVTVKSGNTQALTMAGDMAMLRYRVEVLESTRREEKSRKNP